MGDIQTCEEVKQNAGRGKTKRGTGSWSEGQAVALFQQKHLLKASESFGLPSGWVRVAYPKSG
jgi:hypothetical protein